MLISSWIPAGFTNLKEQYWLSQWLRTEEGKKYQDDYVEPFKEGEFDDQKYDNQYVRFSPYTEPLRKKKNPFVKKYPRGYHHDPGMFLRWQGYRYREKAVFHGMKEFKRRQAIQCSSRYGHMAVTKCRTEYLDFARFVDESNKRLLINTLNSGWQLVPDIPDGFDEAEDYSSPEFAEYLRQHYPSFKYQKKMLYHDARMNGQMRF